MNTVWMPNSSDPGVVGGQLARTLPWFHYPNIFPSNIRIGHVVDGDQINIIAGSITADIFQHAKRFKI